MEPKQNDVLSGRGARFNYHPGNKHFRRMLDAQSDVYAKGTKKQKMMISKAVVESIYSMEPPGRFLKKCADTGQWMELSKREAADKAAQAMAYVVRARARGEATKERRSPTKTLPLATTTSQPSDRPIPLLHANIDSAGAGNGVSSPMAMAHVPAARAWGERWDTTHATSAVNHNTDSDSDPGGRNELVSKHLSLQQQLPPWQQASITNTPGSGAPLNGLAQTVSQAQLLQLCHRRQFSLWYHFMSQHSLGFQTGLLSAPSLGLPSTQFLSAPSSSAQGVSLLPINTLLRRENLLQSNYGYGTDAQLSTLLQSQGNNMQLDDPNVLQSMMGNYQSIFGTAIDPSQEQEAQQVDRVQRGAMLQHHQLSSLTDTSALPSRQQSPPLDLPRPVALLQQNSSQDPPPSIINSAAAKLESSANATVSSTRDSSSKGQTEDDNQR